MSLQIFLKRYNCIFIPVFISKHQKLSHIPAVFFDRVAAFFLFSQIIPQSFQFIFCFLFEGIKLTQNHQITIYGYCGDEKVCEDEAAFTHTDGLEAEYILESGENDGVNWFLDEYGEKKKLEATQGFLSVYDEIGTILDTEKGNEILNGLFISFGEGGKALLTESVQNSILSLIHI